MNYYINKALILYKNNIQHCYGRITININHLLALILYKNNIQLITKVGLLNIVVLSVNPL